MQMELRVVELARVETGSIDREGSACSGESSPIESTYAHAHLDSVDDEVLPSPEGVIRGRGSSSARALALRSRHC